MARALRIYVLTDEVGIRGGAAKATLLLCEALSEAGATVSLFARVAADSSALARLRGKGIAIHDAPLSRGARAGAPARSIAAKAWISSLFVRPDAVFTVGLTSDARHFLSFPILPPVFAWETTEALPGNKFVDAHLTRLLDKVTALLVPSRVVERNARAAYRYEGRVELLPFWVEDSGKGIAPPPRDRRFLFIGRMDSDKGFRFLIPAFQKVRATCGEAMLDICGVGDPRLIPELVNPPDGVNVLGPVSEEKLRELLSNCFALVLPSLHEGYPLSLLEACSHGKPVIATSVGSVPEVYGAREAAIVVPPADTDALSEGMLTLLNETPERYAARASDARTLFEQSSSASSVHAALDRILALVR